MAAAQVTLASARELLPGCVGPRSPTGRACPQDIAVPCQAALPCVQHCRGRLRPTPSAPLAGNQHGAANDRAEPDPSARLADQSPRALGSAAAACTAGTGALRSTLPSRGRWDGTWSREPLSSLQSSGRLRSGHGGCGQLGSARPLCNRAKRRRSPGRCPCPPRTQAVRDGRSSRQVMTFPAAGTHAPVPHSRTHARAGQASPGACGTGSCPGAVPKRPLPRLSPAQGPRAALPCLQPPGRAEGTHAHAGMALAHLSEHLNLPALYDGAIQLLPCPVGICASFKSYKPKTL